VWWLQHKPDCKSWFIEEEHDEVMNDIDSDGDVVAFTTRDAPVALIINGGDKGPSLPQLAKVPQPRN